MPFLVDLQSDLLSGLDTRFVAPLARTRLTASGLPRRLSPAFMVDGLPVVLLPHEAGPISARLLKHRVVSLRPHAHDIIGALDAVIGGV